jgi:DNA-binding LacI/PurR family transcriptional regulator
MAVQKKITMQDVARNAGVSKSTVSLVLNNHPRISEATKAHVQKICRELNYSPNVFAKTLACSSGTQSESRFLGTMGLLISQEFDERKKLAQKSVLWDRQITEACRKAGYKLDSFIIGPTRKEQQAVNRILQARGIQGLLVYGSNEPIHEWDIEWKKFAAIAYSSSLHEHFIHNVMSTSYQDVYEATVRLMDRGYQRPGYFQTYPRLDQWNAGFNSAFQGESGKKPPVPGLSIPDFLKDRQDENRLLKWISKYQPDVILANIDDHLLQILEREGMRVPEDIGFLCLDVWEPRMHLSGLRQLRQTAFQVAADLLHSMLMRNEFGPPEQPICIQVPSLWNEGKTLRPTEAS